MADYEDKKIDNKQFTLFNNESGKSYQIPLIESKDGPNVLDIRKLYQETGLFTFDPGFTSTASCESGITYIDGDKGILRHRGYDIHDLASKSEFLEVCYLLLHGELPSPEDKKKFKDVITNHTMLHEQILRFYSGFRRDSHPMAVMVGIVGALSSFYPEKTYDIQCKKFNLEKTEIKFISRTQWYINWLLSRQLRGTTGTIDYNCSKLLVIMNGKVTTPRLLVMAKLVSTGLLERTHWSWLAEQEHGNGLDFPIKPKFGFDVKKRKMLGDSRHTDASAHPIPAEYFDSYIDIPVESFVDPDAVFISEKTLRPYLCCKPSLCLNAYGHHDYLESIGIKHYTELFDYDKIEQPSLTKRVKGIIDNLVKLSELST